MNAKRPYLEWLRQNILWHLSRADRTIVGILPADNNEPWIKHLFERRQSLQSTLWEIERQLRHKSA
jgi:hypothetical protein